MYNCKILADSISDHDHRLTTFEITLPRIVLAEFNTHRMFSRNSASSRAIPVHKSIDAVGQDPFVPQEFGRNQKGMTAEEILDDEATGKARHEWYHSSFDAINHARVLANLEVHKGLANRILEPYKWQTIIVTATDWDNYFALRCNPQAQGEIRTIAEMMREQYSSHEPRELRAGQWHLPLVRGDERGMTRGGDEVWIKISIGRCARVSYLTHDGKRDLDADVALYERLLQSGHMSPFEHVARPFGEEWAIIDAVRKLGIDTLRQDRYPWIDHPFLYYMDRQIEYAGNFHGWWSARMDVPNQENYALHRETETIPSIH